MTRTALVRDMSGNLKVIRDDWYDSQSEMADELRGNGFRVLKVWNGNLSDSEVDEWEYLNRK